MIYIFQLPDPLRIESTPRPQCLKCLGRCEMVGSMGLPGEWCLAICSRCEKDDAMRKVAAGLQDLAKFVTVLVEQVDRRGFLSAPNVADALTDVLSVFRTKVARAFQIAEEARQAREARKGNVVPIRKGGG